MKPNTHGSLLSISHLLWVTNRNALNCNDLSVRPRFTKAFLGLDIRELHVKTWQKVWNGHVTHSTLSKASKTFGNCQRKLYPKLHLRKQVNSPMQHIQMGEEGEKKKWENIILPSFSSQLQLCKLC